MKNSKIDWESFVMEPINSQDYFDERVLYREIRRRALMSKYKTHGERYSITIYYFSQVSDDIYTSLLNRYCGISDSSKYISNLKIKSEIEIGNLSSSVVDLIISEIKCFLDKEGISMDIVKRRVIKNVIKKS